MSDMQNAMQHLSPVWTHYTNIIASRGEGCYIYDQDGQPYLDFTCGIGVTNTGHCHPAVVAAIQKQAGLLLHGQVNLYLHQPLLDLVNELQTIVNPHLDGFFFSNSGAEAVEGAIKLARHATGRPNVIVFQGSFHGRTIGTMSVTTSKTVYRSGYQPLMPGVFVSPYPYATRFGWDEETTSKWCLEELNFLFLTQSAPQETAAILFEPVMGEGGYVVPPASFVRGLRELCDQHGILLIVDEIQSGFGRTGKWFAQEYFDIEPDIMTIAKGLGSGLPISGVISRLDLMNRWIPGSHGGTFGGNAVAAAGAVATIQVLKSEKLLENAQARGAQLQAGLNRLQKESTSIADIRGLGLMVGCEFRTPDGKPDKATAKSVIHNCLDQHLLLMSCGPWDNTIRWIPPLIVSSQQIDDALAIFEQALEKVQTQ